MRGSVFSALYQFNIRLSTVGDQKLTRSGSMSKSITTHPRAHFYINMFASL